jgi:coniferyl-aldehyde dehydrogenase
LAYCDIDEAIAYVNARPRPLALYYYGRDDEDRRKVLGGTTSGNVTINGTLMHYAQDDLPFGGVGPSGMGAYHGIEGFRTLSHAKGIYVQGRWNGGNLLRAPFGRLTDMALSWMLRADASRPPIEVRNETLVRASAERVWDVLTDVERWPSWYRACRWVRAESPGRGTRPLASPVEGTW